MKAIVDNVFGGRPFPPYIDGVVRALAGGDAAVLLVMIAVAGFALQVLHEMVRAAHTQAGVSTAQAPYAGSDRQARGAVLRVLAGGDAAVADFRPDVVASLVADGLVVAREGVLSLP